MLTTTVTNAVTNNSDNYNNNNINDTNNIKYVLPVHRFPRSEDEDVFEWQNPEIIWSIKYTNTKS